MLSPTTPHATMGHLGLAVEGETVEVMLEDHPTYLDCFLRLNHALLAGDGPLPHHIRRYVAIMASCRHHCNYLVEQQRGEFLEAGGPPEWLEGLDYTPKKIQDLHTTNLILAHQPWLFDVEHVEKLLKSNWSVSELTQAICIMAHFHALSSYVYGAGIENASGELLQNNFPPFLHPNDMACCSGSPNSHELREGGVEVLLERIKTLSLNQNTYNATEEEHRDSFEKMKKQTACLSTPPDFEEGSQQSRCSALSPDQDFVYVDFGPKKGGKSPVPTLKSQDCSWEDTGYSLMHQLYTEVGDILDDKFKTAYSMTYYTCGHQTHVDTYLFRQAVWNYLHCLFGIRHDDYDYGQINSLLERNLKSFLKTVACYPERLSSNGNVPPPIMTGFQQSEKIHVLVLVLEARLQAELLHGLRALEHYLL